MTDTPTRNQFRCITPKRVRYHEVDLQNIVFNANYLMYADVAITEYFRALRVANGLGGDGAFNFFAPDHDMMVRHATIDYRASAKADDMLDLATRITRFGTSSLTSQCAIFRGDALLTVVTITYVHFALATDRPALVPQGFRDMVAAFEVTAPDS
ncbi:acyl-CoA thioesterase [Blastomonas sp.]|uniref:acyl-CoA thioesterase n=1 Tax=Blastomonas sp. TaxID=1909299 RepID=UPI0035937779